MCVCVCGLSNVLSLPSQRDTLILFLNWMAGGLWCTHSAPYNVCDSLISPRTTSKRVVNELLRDITIAAAAIVQMFYSTMNFVSHLFCMASLMCVLPIAPIVSAPTNCRLLKLAFSLKQQQKRVLFCSVAAAACLTYWYGFCIVCANGVRVSCKDARSQFRNVLQFSLTTGITVKS